MSKSTISMAIFNSYVKLPEGISWKIPIYNMMRTRGTPISGNLHIYVIAIVYYSYITDDLSTIYNLCGPPSLFPTA